LQHFQEQTTVAAPTQHLALRHIYIQASAPTDSSSGITLATTKVMPTLFLQWGCCTFQYAFCKAAVPKFPTGGPQSMPAPATAPPTHIARVAVAHLQEAATAARQLVDFLLLVLKLLWPQLPG
jgi:hypothetical protein